MDRWHRPRHRSASGSSSKRRRTVRELSLTHPAGGYIGKTDDLLIADGGTLKTVVIDVDQLFGLDDKRIAVEPSALILRPGGDRFSAVLDMGTDVFRAAVPFDPAKALTVR